MPRKPKEDPKRRKSRRHMANAMEAIAAAHDKLQRALWQLGDVNATALGLQGAEVAMTYMLLDHARQLTESAGRFSMHFADEFIKVKKATTRRTS